MAAVLNTIVCLIVLFLTFAAPLRAQTPGNPPAADAPTGFDIIRPIRDADGNIVPATPDPVAAARHPLRTDCDLTDLRRLVDQTPPGQWREISGSAMRQILLTEGDPAVAYGSWGIRGSAGVISAWNGGAFDGCAWYFVGGGHLAYGGNEVYRFDLSTQAWARLTDPTPYLRASPDDPCRGIADKSLPVPAHNYDGLIYSPATRSVFMWSFGSYCDERGTLAGAKRGDPSTGHSQLWEFEPETLRWTWHHKPPDAWYSPKTALVGDSGRITVCRSQYCWLFDPVARRYSPRSPNAGFEERTGYGAAAFDQRRNLMVMIGNGRFYAAAVHENGLGALDLVGKALMLGNVDRYGIAYDAARDVFALWQGDGTVYRLDPADWRLYREVAAGGPVPRPATEGVYSRWEYVDALDAFIGMDNVDQGFWLYRLTERPGREVPIERPCFGKPACPGIDRR